MPLIVDPETSVPSPGLFFITARAAEDDVIAPLSSAFFNGSVRMTIV